MEPASEKMGWPQGFVLYNEKDLMARQIIVSVFTNKLQSALTELNRAVRFVQIETPMLTYKEALKGHEAIGFDLVKAGFAKHGASEMYLRPETTFGTYAAFRTLYPEEQKRKKEMPLCLWQYGKSFRDEQSRPFSELRFKEFYQLEYQLFFAPDSKADYFGTALSAAGGAVKSILGLESAMYVPVKADQLAHYSTRTTDLYMPFLNEKDNIEMAAVSERSDFEGAKVVEVSVGLDRLTAHQVIL
jgi:glycyl-tRNA synthetase (class II)